MKIYDKINITLDLNIPGEALAIGFFEIHLGHKHIINKMRKTNNNYSILTFSSNLKNSPLILTKYEKEKMLNSLGIKSLFIIDFNQKK